MTKGEIIHNEQVSCSHDVILKEIIISDSFAYPQHVRPAMVQVHAKQSPVNTEESGNMITYPASFLTTGGCLYSQYFRTRPDTATKTNNNNSITQNCYSQHIDFF